MTKNILLLFILSTRLFAAYTNSGFVIFKHANADYKKISEMELRKMHEAIHGELSEIRANESIRF